MKFTRRDVIRTTAGAAAGVLGSRFASSPAFAQEGLQYKPEDGAKLRLLRWSPFVQGDEDQWLANTKRFTEATGVEVRVDKESWEDIRPKAAVAANVGSGPDLMLVWFDDPHQYPDKLHDVTELGEYLGTKYGGWHDGPKQYATREGKFLGLPLATIGNAIVYRESWVKEAGFSEFPKDTAGLLELCKALQAKGHPAGFTHGHGVGDGNNYAHWLLWSHGGQMVDESGKVTINSPETLKSIEYAQELYKTFIPGTESWLDVNNNRAFLAGELSVIANGISAYNTAKINKDNDPKLTEIAKDIRTTNLPIGPVGKSVELFQVTTAVIFDYTPYPNAAKAYLQFMFEEQQMAEWITSSAGYCCQTLKAFDNNPVWTADPNNAAYAKASATLRPNGFAGPLGYASAATMADYVLVDMFAKAVTGQATPQEAMEEAEKRANRYYRV
ncbi:carbohydrate ABC transporter substrate-binding protein [Mesorhizobium sp. M9A.F.Ca.ET.002.03.1.2]|uniref:ABC transporter substrate-binding protein n=1 Tax=Mesorhizobium sp. M9A.F.Ca.ET.002.03.1.2 TaxID=2493668 RepID=UPI000F757277|nr:ABC transporter substrate-binding protein [Mesorhizobium sp. M9A.F.Ca.ET.002.03.1.2]AZN99512.1 carbohydrate ABC transporter substrate-binding protein [Mesorhizobium sp. M9A.F.Ca.ET.002.03.1.2]